MDRPKQVFRTSEGQNIRILQNISGATPAIALERLSDGNRNDGPVIKVSSDNSVARENTDIVEDHFESQLASHPVFSKGEAMVTTLFVSAELYQPTSCEARVPFRSERQENRLSQFVSAGDERDVNEVLSSNGQFVAMTQWCWLLTGGAIDVNDILCLPRIDN